MNNGNIVLRDYQRNIIEQLAVAWQKCRSVMVQMPTGTGKTHVLAEVIKRSFTPTSVWVIAHRRELVAQASETLKRHGVGLVDGSVKVMSIQWLVRHWDDVGGRPALVIIDEAHHAQAKTYRMLWKKCPDAKFLGLTATPCRMNHSGFTDLFDMLITSWSIADFIRRGHLSLFDYVSIRRDSEEQRLIDSLEKRGADGDYQIKEMDAVLNRTTSIERLYKSVDTYARGKKGIVYAINIAHACSIAAYYNSRGMGTAVIDSNTPADERRRLIGEFKDNRSGGGLRVLVNVDIFSEGFDCPDVEFVQMARPTLSLSKYLQQVGRGLRRTEGKDVCVLIDNVGLYRVFGLPTVTWDWEIMFLGRMAGKGRQQRCEHNLPVADCCDVKIPVSDTEMETIMSHERLLADLETHSAEQPLIHPKKAGLRSWQDNVTGLWGLRAGYKDITDACFIKVFDIRYDMAAVRFTDCSCGLVDKAGKCVWKQKNAVSLKFASDRLLCINTSSETCTFLDLCNLRIYSTRPTVKCFGGVELLKTDSVYCSRTREVYVNDQNINDSSIVRRAFFVTIFDYKMPVHFSLKGKSSEYECGYMCIFDDDAERYYRMYRRLGDGSVIVADSTGRYYHVEEGKAKEYIGCCDTAAELKKCKERVGRIASRVSKAHDEAVAGKVGNRLHMLSGCEAMPFRSGMKWGLKVGGNIIIPPIYRNIKSPVGKYCAVEKNYSQWGVVALDGRIMIEPQYSDVEISAQGIVTGTKVTGSKVSVKLP